MTYRGAMEILKRHNKWRRGDDDFLPAKPKELGEAIDLDVLALEIMALKDEQFISQFKENK